ncbi:glycosyl transferase [Microbacterium schleiferi]|uniref:glycosyl transferase n=1 Tax=Microbacterium schleiferi TaxID=69362 RepID=UPI00311D9D52
MRFVWAVVALVLATVMIGAGIAQRTIFQGPRSTTADVSITEDEPYLVIDGALLTENPGSQTLRVLGDGPVFAAYGRTADVQAWLADATYNQVVQTEDGSLVTEEVEPAPEPEATVAPTATPATEAPTGDGAATGDAATDQGSAEEAIPGRNPAGSDLWLDEYQQDDLVIAPLQLPADMSVIIASDGTEPAPTTVSVTWPIENSTPWAGPLIVGGGILMAVGVVLYVLGIRHVRRSRGPRRKGLPLPVTEPIDLSVAEADKGVISAGKPRRALGRGRTSFLAIPVVAVTVGLLSGCTSDAWPQLVPSETPSPTASVIVPEGQQAPAVTKQQAERIVEQVAQTVAQADEAKDADLAATRLDGALLAERKTNYTLRSAIADYAMPTAVPGKPVEVVLPQAFNGWPRSFLAVVTDDEANTSSIMVLTQADPWTPYKLSYIGNLGGNTLMPELAPSYIGASQLAPDSPFLLLPPDELAAAYADVLDKGDESAFAGMFDEQSDLFRAGVIADRKERLDDFNQTGAETGSLTFSAAAGEFAPFAIATLESGAIVAVSIAETDTVKPTNEDAVIKLDNNATVKTLAGADQSASGFSTTFSDQLFFYVPEKGSSEPIRLLGYSSSILKGSVL